MSVALGMIVLSMAGCNAARSDGEPLAAIADRASDDQQAKEAVPPAPVSDDEKAAMEAFEKLGATIDRDKGGHARLVELTDTQVTNDDLKQLGRLPQLESLEVTGGTVDDAGVANLSGLAQLQRLYLNKLNVTDAGLAALEKLVHLKVLSLKNTKIDGEGLKLVTKLPHLEVLNLAGTKVADDTFGQIQQLKDLDTLVAG